MPLAFDDFAVVPDPPGGPERLPRTLNDCHRVWPDGRVEQLGWPRVKIHYNSGTRTPSGATIRCTNAAGDR